MKKSHLFGAVRVLLGCIFCFPNAVFSASVNNFLAFGGSKSDIGIIYGNGSLTYQLNGR